MDNVNRNKILEIIAEIGVIFAAANVLFYVQKSFQPSIWNFVIALIMLVAAIWLKTQQK